MEVPLVVPTLGKEGPERMEAREAAKHCTDHRTASKKNSYPAQNVKVQTEMSMLRLRDIAMEYSIIQL